MTRGWSHAYLCLSQAQANKGSFIGLSPTMREQDLGLAMRNSLVESSLMALLGRYYTERVPIRFRCPCDRPEQGKEVEFNRLQILNPQRRGSILCSPASLEQVGSKCMFGKSMEPRQLTAVMVLRLWKKVGKERRPLI